MGLWSNGYDNEIERGSTPLNPITSIYMQHKSPPGKAIVEKQGLFHFARAATDRRGAFFILDLPFKKIYFKNFE